MKTFNKFAGIMFLFGIIGIITLLCMNESVSGAVYGTLTIGAYLLLYIIINGAKLNKQNEDLYLKTLEDEKRRRN